MKNITKLQSAVKLLLKWREILLCMLGKMWKSMFRYFTVFLKFSTSLKYRYSMLHRYCLSRSFCQQMAGIISSLIFFDQRIHLSVYIPKEI